ERETDCVPLRFAASIGFKLVDGQGVPRIAKVEGAVPDLQVAVRCDVWNRGAQGRVLRNPAYEFSDAKPAVSKGSSPGSAGRLELYSGGRRDCVRQVGGCGI